jgi:hypothetical protein
MPSTRRAFAGALTAAIVGATPKTKGDVSEYRLILARGTHRELGRQHGEQAADQIRQHLDVMCAGHKISIRELRRRSLFFQPMFDRHCPHLLDEIRGLAEGARIDTADALACNIRSLPKHAVDDGCTAYVVSRSGTT